MNMIVKTILGVLLMSTANIWAMGIQDSHSGSWYNKDQSGHGFSFEVLDASKMVVYWFVYTPDGEPTFLVALADIDGDTAYGNLRQYSGMRFGEFDPATLHREVWGEISIEFLGCNSAVLIWSSNVEGYGDGQVELERLTHIAGQECVDVAAEMTGEWQVEFVDEGGGPYSVTVDAEGAFEFYDALACLWQGNIHVEFMGRGRLTARFGSPTCPWPVPMLNANGWYYANGATFCSSGGSCISYDQAMTFESEWYEDRTIKLMFLR